MLTFAEARKRPGGTTPAARAAPSRAPHAERAGRVQIRQIVQAAHVIHRADDKGTPPAKAPPVPKNVGGDLASKKIIRIAWTFDDGPDPQTAPMKKVMESKNITATTWFVMYNKIAKDLDKQVTKMLAIQNAGGEIGIHSMHQTDDHVAWFPMAGVPSYADIDTAMKDLATFQAVLTGKGIKIKFVREPYGLHSELMSYLQKEAYKGDVDQTARDIIAGKPVTGKAVKVKADYDKLQATLTKLKLHLWGGSGGAKPETAELSWEAESSGSPDRADSLTRHVSAERQAGPAQAEDNPGKFERTVNGVTESQPRSLIVLAHDTTPGDVAEVEADIATMEEYAKKQGVKIEYYTVSDLYKILRP